MSTSNFYVDGKLKDYYSILQVDRNAEPEVISFAYKALAKKNHPDLGGTAERMKEINEAYEVLNDPASKSEYDPIYDAEKMSRQNSTQDTGTGYKQAREDNATSQKQEVPNNYGNQAGTSTYEEKAYRSPNTSANYNESEALTKTLKENLSENTYEVFVRGHFFTLPWGCVCCLDRPDSKINVQYKFSERNLLSRTNKLIAVPFPICRNCKNHIREFSIKMFLFLTISLLPSTMLSIFLLNKFPHTTWATLIIVGGVVTIVSAFLSNALIKMSPIEDRHASRGAPVAIVSCDEWGTRFLFSNWFYAVLFAKDNGSQTAKVAGKKDGRDRSFLNKASVLHRLSIILMLMVAIITILLICLEPAKHLWGIIQKVRYPF